jgi:hypothetical protein
VDPSILAPKKFTPEVVQTILQLAKFMKIRESTIPGAGLGVFYEGPSDIQANTTIGVYTGRIVTECEKVDENLSDA